MPAEASSSAPLIAPSEVPVSETAPREDTSLAAWSRGINGHARQPTRDAILHPGTIKINVQGAFIVDEDSPTPCTTGRTTPVKFNNGDSENGNNEEYFDYRHDTQDIRLPNHTQVVSHIAIDVSMIAYGPAHVYCTSAKSAQRTNLAGLRLVVPSRNSSTFHTNLVQ